MTARAPNVKDLDVIPLEKIEEARMNLEHQGVLKTPLVPLNIDLDDKKIYLKLENLQPIGSFKIRGALNAIKCTPPVFLSNGVYTASAGNFAQGLAWGATKLGIPAKIVVPENAPQMKVDSIQRYGGEVIRVPYDDWWGTMMSHTYPGLEGEFVHPVCDPNVIAGNGTAGLEILEDLPDVDAIIAPFGGGGLLCGIASVMKSKKPSTKIYACEVETAAPLSASLAAKQPWTCDYEKTFIDGMGAKCVLPGMWNLISNLVDDSIVLSVEEIADAIRLLVTRHHMIAEGAGAAPLAAALSGKAGSGNIVCVISGGNIDNAKLISILQGHIPN
ncbi:unnamed protein product [Owenia fusiformis]|uniref:L-serine deaminase n=1 Tax=Owenia fusiformis TaxID=6347 RepID=A0A8J1UQ73_OWEFU|nr:unnamed protein product [Owenia fusiformis]